MTKTARCSNHSAYPALLDAQHTLRCVPLLQTFYAFRLKFLSFAAL
jgi:hypothetical protein